MAKCTFTELFAKAKDRIPSDKVQVDYWDTQVPGFGLRVTNKGTRTWQVVGNVKVDGKWKPFRKTIGRVGTVTLAEARRAAQEVLDRAKVDREDVRAKAENARRQQAEREAAVARTRAEGEAAAAEARRNEYTFASIRKAYLDAKAPTGDARVDKDTKRLKPRIHGQYTYELSREWLAPWESRPIDSITVDEIEDLLSDIRDEVSENAAFKQFKMLRGMWRWASKRREYRAIVLPISGVEPPAKASARTRVLSEAELGILLQVLDRPRHFERVTKLLILTGQRKNEIAHLAWHEIQQTADKIPLVVLPESRTKNKVEHKVPLVPSAAEVLKDLPRVDHCAFVFTHNGKTPLSGWSKFKKGLDEMALACRDQQIANAEAMNYPERLDALRQAFREPWILHDLRRTFVTGLNNLGVMPHVVEATVNHTSGPSKAGVAGVYNAAMYMPERVIGLNLWAAHVAKLAQDYKIISAKLAA